MWDDEHGIIGIGYEGLEADQLVEQLRGWGVATLVDVRLNPISRKRGFSKKALSALLGESGIEYRHMPALGNPKDNRAGFADDPASDDLKARERFREMLEAEVSKQAVEELAELASRQHVAVLCFERSELHCHRREVLSAVRPLLDELVAV